MSTNFYLEQTCNLGCHHRIHVGKRGGNGQGGHRFTFRLYEPGHCEVPSFVVEDPADLTPQLYRLYKENWELMDEYGEKSTPEEMLEYVTAYRGYAGVFS